MNFVTHMPKSERGNTFLLLFQDMLSGFVMYKPMPTTTVQDVAEAYEERVFRVFGASDIIRHDQVPRFMSEVFILFRELLGSRQRSNLSYGPQTNRQHKRPPRLSFGVAYVAVADLSDWDYHSERLMFALNTSFDATRLDTPFYLVHGCDAHSIVSSMLGTKPSSLRERTAYEWKRIISARLQLYMRLPPEKSKAYETGSSDLERARRAFKVWIQKGRRGLGVYTQGTTKIEEQAGTLMAWPIRDRRGPQ
ncbi:LOW QUALITY PROTEIN: reverse transcriptase [Phytophthora megakarya]|uniref:Reverse transcriptase n=1 Tax=Phytophthora megakarya TaxID=4795 RepID=A0A225WC13_9STRA|nr:LOW QUALITY PROTEIN: reverse transcriptase [Phytophthora megakarya]